MRLPLKAYFRPLYFTYWKLRSGQLSFPQMAYFKTLYFSQFGEDVYLDNVFRERKTGFYVDVGAFHPYNVSNTCAFYLKGWRGINIEPNPLSFRAFPKHRPRDINLNLAVSALEGEVVFNCLEDLSGIDDTTHLFRNRAKTANQCRVTAMPLRSILQKHMPEATTIDFMTIDCEGHDLEVLTSNDWTRFRPHVILVEDHEHNPGAVENLLNSVDYRLDRKLALTKVFFDQSQPSTQPS